MPRIELLALLLVPVFSPQRPSDGNAVVRVAAVTHHGNWITTPTVVQEAPRGDGPLRVFHSDSLFSPELPTDVVARSVLKGPFLSLETLEIPGGRSAERGAGELDRVYYIWAGSASLRVGSEALVSYDAGDIAYVKAGVDHHWVAGDGGLRALVVSSASATGMSDNALRFDQEAIYRGRMEERNHWNPFLKVPAFITGMYMLPQRLGGDNFLTHRWDEFNIIVHGGSTFVAGDESVRVRPGSVMYVEHGTPHKFTELDADHDIVILWDRQ